MTDENENEVQNEEEAATWAEFEEAEAAPAAEAEQSQDAAEIREEPEEQKDLWAEAPEKLRMEYEDLKKQYAKVEQSDRSQRGRLSALQRQINEINSKAAPPQEAAEPDDNGWDTMLEEYPEIAKPLSKKLKQMESYSKKLEAEISTFGNDRRRAIADEQTSLLAAEAPDWMQHTQDPGFMSWLDEQPRHIQEAAARNGQEIVDYREAADVVNRFREYKGASSQQTNKLAGKRQQQLKSASSTKGRGPGAVNGIAKDGDPETLWKQWEEMERRRPSSY